MKSTVFLNFLLYFFLAVFERTLVSSKEKIMKSSTSRYKSSHSVIKNISYGKDKQQVMDVWLPRSENIHLAKVVMLIHGGAWRKGKKEDMLKHANWITETFPQHVVTSIDYRHGTRRSPGFPKQIEDIHLALTFLKSKAAEYKLQNNFALFGVSAGAHMSMLYAYAHDKDRDINIICNLFGHSDFTDSNFLRSKSISTKEALGGKVGRKNYAQFFETVSPVTHIDSDSPKTISFYGEKDKLVPSSQGTRLKTKLENSFVHNKLYIYQNERHSIKNPKNLKHFHKKVVAFFQKYF